jgi:hypothetical protein
MTGGDCMRTAVDYTLQMYSHHLCVMTSSPATHTSVSPGWLVNGAVHLEVLQLLCMHRLRML